MAADCARVSSMIGVTTRTLRARKKDANRRTIEDAAWSLFRERGYDNTSVNDIAERANVAPRTFFRYFPHKQAVLYGEFDDALAEVGASFRRRPADEPILTAVFASLEAISDHMSSLPAARRDVFMEMKRAGHSTSTDYFRERLTALVAELVSEREAGNPDAGLQATMASGIVGLVMQVANQQCLELRNAGSLDDQGRRCLSVLTRLVTSAGNS